MNKKIHRLYISILFFIGLSVTILLFINGYSYYSTPLEERFFHPSHNDLKPSGLLGHGFGILGSLMMIFGVSIYMIRKRVKRLHHIGYLKHWLEFHIFLCTVGPVLVLFHTAFKFGGIVSVSFWSMVIVVFSGIIGRFIYVRIPRTINGQEIDVAELIKKRNEMYDYLKNEILFDKILLEEFNTLTSTQRYNKLSIRNSFLFFIKDYLHIKKIKIRIFNYLLDSKIDKFKLRDIKRLLNKEIILVRRIGFLRIMQKLFHYWHIFHLPFALTMFLIMIIHVLVTIIFGYKWIF